MQLIFRFFWFGFPNFLVFARRSEIFNSFIFMSSLTTINRAVSFDLWYWNSTCLDMSPLLLLFARPSLAFEISPLISPMRFWVFSSCAFIGRLLNFCVRSFTVWSRLICNNNRFSSFSESVKETAIFNRVHSTSNSFFGARLWECQNLS